MNQVKDQKIFGTDGVRGRANHYPMTVEVALSLGRAIGKVFKRHNGKHRVVIGKDTRLSCYMYENALIAGLCSMGVDTLMVGPLPTPGVAFITRAYRADAGIVISASHNPFYDNGIKIFSSDGFKLSDDIESEIESIVHRAQFDDSLPSDSDLGKNFKVDDANGRYIEFAKSSFPKKKSLYGITVALDCANGAGHRVAPMIFRELDAEVISIGDRPDGLNINRGCGSMHPEAVKKIVMDHNADVGIALDGDADRLIMVDEKGQIIDGDMILAICAKRMKEKKTLKNNRVVSTVMANYGFIKAMEDLGIETILSGVGDRYVIQKMIQEEAVLGGEQSGHIIFSDYNTTGDGLVSALQVLGIMAETGARLSELSAFVKRYPQALINVRVAKKTPLENLGKVQECIEEAEQRLSDEGRVLVRYSGTESICRVMVEGKETGLVEELAAQIAKAVENEIGVSE